MVDLHFMLIINSGSEMVIAHTKPQGDGLASLAQVSHRSQTDKKGDLICILCLDTDK